MNQETGNYETFHRQYDAAIGRFTAVDIMASSFSNQTPYQYANNDPVYFNDPLGDYGRGGSIYDEMKDRMGHKSTSPANDGFSGFSHGESFAQQFNARMAYRNDVLGWAQAGYADAHQEYAQMYGATIDPRIIDYYTNGIATEENYIDTEYIYDLGEGDQNGGTDPNRIYVYSPYQINKIRNASDDGMALHIAMYSTQNRFVDDKGNPSDYAERTFKNKFPGSDIRFPSNGRAGLWVSGQKDILIMGLNYETGEFEPVLFVDTVDSWWDTVSDADKERMANIGINIVNLIRAIRGYPPYDPFVPGVPIVTPEGYH
ncbi:hypothetical protein LVD17_27260 [Fulvivirga ulvae]|uniref:RHS repeat-associated core domain-containing protein n=1 Tax=Fulvivirga ulvae TaxID=2904245 RepID=UPI001F346065|nr:RHS repeat-associated core domain-containing protein [Fulvivirga ulvae]UII31991.1 hypothetical protein LVD17_27260 [Fulvivirga ulvae]